MIRKIFKTGHSYAVTLSKRVLEQSGFKLGDTVKVEADAAAGKITIRPDIKNTQLSLELKSKPRLGSLMLRK